MASVLSDRLILADDPLVEDILQPQQLIPLALHQLGNGNPGPPLDDPGDLLLGDLIVEQAGIALASPRDPFLLLKLPLQVRQAAVFQLRQLVQVVGLRSAFSISPLTCSISSRSFCTLPMAAFSFSHFAFSSLNW